MVVVVNAGVVKDAPTCATLDKAASLYQVKTGLITVPDEADKLVVEFLQITFKPVRLISDPVDKGLTLMETTRAVDGVFSHFPSPLTVT